MAGMPITPAPIRLRVLPGSRSERHFLKFTRLSSFFIGELPKFFFFCDDPRINEARSLVGPARGDSSASGSLWVSAGRRWRRYWKANEDGIWFRLRLVCVYFLANAGHEFVLCLMVKINIFLH